MIIVEDPQILNLDTPHGTVQFLQVVGVLKEEFHYVRSWTAGAIVEQLMQQPQVWHLMITDMRRKVSVFDLNPRHIIDSILKNWNTMLFTRQRGRVRITYYQWLFFCFIIRSAHAQWEEVLSFQANHYYIFYINKTDHQGSSFSWAKLINGSLVQYNIILYKRGGWSRVHLFLWPG